jgi:hypothetical protein
VKKKPHPSVYRGQKSKAPSTLAVYEWIKAEVSAGRPFPTVAQIALRQGWSESAGHDVLNRLVRMGYLKVVKREHIEQIGRGWRYTYELREDVGPNT